MSRAFCWFAERNVRSRSISEELVMSDRAELSREDP